MTVAVVLMMMELTSINRPSQRHIGWSSTRYDDGWCAAGVAREKSHG